MISILIDPLVWMTIAFVIAIMLALSMRRCASCAIMLLVLLLLLILVASPVLTNRWLGTLEDQYPTAACGDEAQNIPTVALAGGLVSGFSNLGLTQRLSDASKNRTLAAAAIVPSNSLLILSGGSPHPERANEAEAMAELARPILADGVKLIAEIQSTDTKSNAFYVGALLDNMELERNIVLVTSRWHLPRSVETFERQGFKVCAHGVDPRQGHVDSWTALLPRVTAIQKTSISIHEWVGMLYYRHFYSK